MRGVLAVGMRLQGFGTADYLTVWSGSRPIIQNFVREHGGFTMRSVRRGGETFSVVPIP